MMVVVAVSFLRGSATRSHAGREGTGRPEWEPRETAFQRLAKKPEPHHQHVDIKKGVTATRRIQDVAHVDQNIMQQRGASSGQPTGEDV